MSTIVQDGLCYPETLSWVWYRIAYANLGFTFTPALLYLVFYPEARQGKTAWIVPICNWILWWIMSIIASVLAVERYMPHCVPYGFIEHAMPSPEIICHTVSALSPLMLQWIYRDNYKFKPRSLLFLLSAISYPFTHWIIMNISTFWEAMISTMIGVVMTFVVCSIYDFLEIFE
jgi:hypothetical protein